MSKEVKIEGYLCRSEGYNNLEFYDKPPKRLYGEGDHPINHWTYSEVCCIKILPLEMMPELTWEDEPVKVILTLGIEKV